LICEECKKNIAVRDNKCEECLSKNLLKIRQGKYYFQGQAFKKNSWYRKMANYLSFEDKGVRLRRTPDEIRIEYIRTFVLKNIKKTTFLMLILPCILFLLVSFILLLGTHFYQFDANYLNLNQIIFLRFLGLMFLLLGALLLIKIIIFQDKVIMLGTDKRVKMKHITKEQYYQVLEVFKK